MGGGGPLPTAALLEAVHRRTGVTITTRGTIYLLRFDQQPEDFSISLTSEPSEFPLPLFVQAGQESCQAIVAQSRSYPYLLVHELVETSLISKSGGSVLPDLAWGAPGARMYVNNYTRWFREGFANYAGFVAYEIAAGEVPSDKRLCRREPLVHTEPFSSLSQVGDKLFSWPQSGKTKLERAYYNAALGLFLLITDTFGEQAIRDIIHEIAQRRAVNGRDLIEITNRVLKTDVRQLAGSFEFPRVGAEVEQMTPALFRKDKDKVRCDERDLAIQRKATIAAYVTFWGLFVAAAMIPWFITGPDGMITVNYLPWMVFGGMFVVMLMQAIVTLGQYGWTDKETSHE
jgi:hypothetical protein